MPFHTGQELLLRKNEPNPPREVPREEAMEALRLETTEGFALRHWLFTRETVEESGTDEVTAEALGVLLHAPPA
jgi:hypothetical protein